MGAIATVSKPRGYRGHGPLLQSERLQPCPFPQFALTCSVHNRNRAEPPNVDH